MPTGIRGPYGAAVRFVLVIDIVSFFADFTTKARVSIIGAYLAADWRFPTVFWIYLAGAGLVAPGFADYRLIAHPFARAGTVRYRMGRPQPSTPLRAGR